MLTGVAQGEAQATLEWQRRMDDYVAKPGAGSGPGGWLTWCSRLKLHWPTCRQQMAQDVLHLACDIARQVLRHELSVNPNAVQPVVREAVGMLGVRGAPGHGAVEPVRHGGRWPSLCAKSSRVLPCNGWPTLQVAPGGCLVESAGTVVDGSLDNRWQRAVAALGLQSAWQDDGDDH